MTKINLLKYFDKSFSEIYQIEHGEIEETPSKKSPKRVRIHLLTLSYLLAFILLILAGFFTYKLFHKPNKTITQKPIKTETPTQIKTDKKTVKPSEKKYVKIAEIKILDETNNGITPKQQPDLSKKNEIKHKTNTHKPSKPSTNNEVKKEKPKKITYYYKLTFYKVDSTNFNKLKSFAQKYNLHLKQLKKYKVIKTIWRVYAISPGASQYIAGKPVKYLKYFGNKNKAIQYVKSKKLKAVIKKDKIIYYLYDLSLYPLKDVNMIAKLKKSLKLKNIKTTKILNNTK
ncbi:hypothetical protein FHQ18_06220 [Deferribacter autotrophicus]|uniref:Uncharacterized protein n=1 Tax=Deferribacter autotrophicus TaxID=500465 RepID=A0A5A8F4H2_9BACT|nr:hypothetical protein [Deferribacter autotrophicus]KAA0257985.1 hypothetical protein FHQ18_06220 [Deferribacter autotrophicus]